MSVTIFPMIRTVLACAVFAGWTVGGGHSTLSAATPPRAVIDVGLAVECRDVTPAESVAAHRSEKVVEATFRLSVLSQSVAEQDLEQLQVTIGSPAQRLRVVDFQPRTAVASELAGDVEVCSSDEMVQSLNASLGGVVSGDQGPVHAQATPAAGVGVTKNRGSKETFHRLAPKQLVLASGTMNAEHAVFFKWRRSSQATLEGSREITCRFLVPHGWRGDWVQLQADLIVRHRNYFGDRFESGAQAAAFVALYLGDDAEAQQAASSLAAVQSRESAAGSGVSSARTQTVYKPVTAATPASAQEKFVLPSFLRICDHTRDAGAEPGRGAPRSELSTALYELQRLSGGGE